MTTAEFLVQFSRIEEHLFSEVHGYAGKMGFRSLLQYIRIKAILPIDMIQELETLFHVRNQLMNSRVAGMAPISPETNERLQKMNAYFHI